MRRREDEGDERRCKERTVLLKNLFKRWMIITVLCVIAGLVLTVIDTYVFHDTLPGWLVLIRNVIVGIIIGFASRKKYGGTLDE